MNIEIANRLLRLRKEHGFSQEDLAAKIGISRQSVSKWERAEASPDTDNLIALARLYGVSLDDLLLTETRSEEAGGKKEDCRREESVHGEGPPPDENGGPNKTEAALTAGPPAGPGFKSSPISSESSGMSLWLAFPYPVFITILFLLLGCFGWWHPGWLVFLTIPLYYTLFPDKES